MLTQPQTPGIAENFGFRLVENRMCTTAEYSAWVAQYEANLQAAFGPGGDVNLFNPHVANGPTCLMTREMVLNNTQTYSWPPVSAPDASLYQDELCFSGAAAHVLAPALAAAVAVFAFIAF